MSKKYTLGSKPLQPQQKLTSIQDSDYLGEEVNPQKIQDVIFVPLVLMIVSSIIFSYFYLGMSILKSLLMGVVTFIALFLIFAVTAFTLGLGISGILFFASLFVILSNIFTPWLLY